MIPTLETLTARFLARQASSPQVIEDQEVVPHEVVTGFRANAASTWRDATAALALFGEALAVPMPPEWPAFVSQLRDTSILPLCLAAVPQRVRDVAPKPDRSANGPAGVSESLTLLRKWIRTTQKSGSTAEIILAGAVNRAMGDFDTAQACFDSVKATGSLALILANERAALLWHRGELAQAHAAWKAMGDHPVVSFNRAVCDWQMGNLADAERGFDIATKELPDSIGWSHLAGLSMVACESA